MSVEFDFLNARIEDIAVHRVGNKVAEESYQLSEASLYLDVALSKLLCNYFLSAFKSQELYNFSHEFELKLNEVYTCASAVFDNPSALYEQSVNLAKHLYNRSIHPQIKGGEVCVVYFSGCVMDSKMYDVVGIFKAENKDTFLEVEEYSDGIGFKSKHGINTNKLDKGCLIFNTKRDGGYVVSIVDNTNRGSEAAYWRDEFLKVQPIANEFHQTNQFLTIAKNFVTKRLEEEFEVSPTDKIDLLNRSVEYFKTHESFDKKEFESEVFQEENLINSFRNFDTDYRQEYNIEVNDQFDISKQAVKKQARVFKSVLKLDKNFHIYIHGNREMIERGIDEDGRKYYKIYYEEES